MIEHKVHNKQFSESRFIRNLFICHKWHDKTHDDLGHHCEDSLNRASARKHSMAVKYVISPTEYVSLRFENYRFSL